MNKNINKSKDLSKEDQEHVLSCNICRSREVFHSFTRPDRLRVFECSKCKLAYVSPRPTEEGILKTYENTDTDFKILKERFYEERRIGNSKYILKRIARFKKLRGARMLDVGCGPGFLLQEARKAGMNALGLEISNIFAAFGREELNLDIRQTILEEANLPQESFDIIICNNLIEHLYNPNIFFSYINQILSPGGILHILTPNYDGTKKYGNKWPGFYRDFEHIYYFNSFSLTYALKSFGLKPLKLFYLPLRAGLTGKENVNSENITSEMKAKIRRLLLSIPLLNRQIWKILSWIRILLNWKSIKRGTAFEMGAIFIKEARE